MNLRAQQRPGIARAEALPGQFHKLVLHNSAADGARRFGFGHSHLKALAAGATACAAQHAQQGHGRARPQAGHRQGPHGQVAGRAGHRPYASRVTVPVM